MSVLDVRALFAGGTFSVAGTPCRSRIDAGIEMSGLERFSSQWVRVIPFPLLTKKDVSVHSRLKCVGVAAKGRYLDSARWTNEYRHSIYFRRDAPFEAGGAEVAGEVSLCSQSVLKTANRLGLSVSHI